MLRKSLEANDCVMCDVVSNSLARRQFKDCDVCDELTSSLALSNTLSRLNPMDNVLRQMRYNQFKNSMQSSVRRQLRGVQSVKNFVRDKEYQFYQSQTYKQRSYHPPSPAFKSIKLRQHILNHKINNLRRSQSQILDSYSGLLQLEDENIRNAQIALATDAFYHWEKTQEIKAKLLCKECVFEDALRKSQEQINNIRTSALLNTIEKQRRQHRQQILNKAKKLMNTEYEIKPVQVIKTECDVKTVILEKSKINEVNTIPQLKTVKSCYLFQKQMREQFANKQVSDEIVQDSEKQFRELTARLYEDKAEYTAQIDELKEKIELQKKQIMEKKTEENKLLTEDHYARQIAELDVQRIQKRLMINSLLEEKEQLEEFLANTKNKSQHYSEIEIQHTESEEIHEKVGDEYQKIYEEQELNEEPQILIQHHEENVSIEVNEVPQILIQNHEENVSIEYDNNEEDLIQINSYSNSVNESQKQEDKEQDQIIVQFDNEEGTIPEQNSDQLNEQEQEEIQNVVQVLQNTLEQEKDDNVLTTEIVQPYYTTDEHQVLSKRK